MADKQQDIIIDKRVFPTSLSSRDIRLFWSNKLKEQSLFSARTAVVSYLEKVKQVLVDYQTNLSYTDAGLPITQGLQRARQQMLEKLNDLGLVERNDDGEVIQGKMTNLGSAVRLNLIVKTNTALAHSLRQKMDAQNPLVKILRPAFELRRLELRENPRDWQKRWIECANYVNWKGVAKNTNRMIAKTDSPIWEALGNRYPDSLGVDRPPFCFGSGMGWMSVTAKELKENGITFDDEG